MLPSLLGLLAGGAVFLLLGPGPMPGRPTPLARLYAKLGATPVRSVPATKPPWVRKLPLAPLSALVRQAYPRRWQERMERQLRISRLDATHTYDDILAMKVAAALACGFYALLLFLKGRDALLAAFMTGLAAMGFMYPDIWLASKARKRQEQIRRELPAVLSALAVALEAGLNLMAAIAEVTRGRSGALAFELRQAVDLYERGLPPADALERVALRLEVSEFTVTLTGLMQAFAKGSGHVVGTVRTQATEAWQKRKRRAEAMAQTASIKLFMPIALLALPGFMIFLLGPAVLEVIDYLLK
ncbi:MAG TPA: type II secretion system F family protein [Symbiobacteriaceae bacterium]|nr:type II secretion system F family protein [Symbiobacteriaceae bacterium]